MRNLLLLLSLLIITSFSTEARHRFEFLEGKFVNPYFGEQIKIKSIRGGIMVKGVHGSRGWQRYYSKRGRSLIPDRGRGLIDVVGPHRVVVKRNRWSRGIHYIRKPARGITCSAACCMINRNRYEHYNQRNRGTYDNRGGYGPIDSYDYDGRYNHRESNNRDRRSRDFSLDLSSFTGEWYSNELRKLVIVEESGNRGFKARVSGSKQWTEYQYNGKYWIDNRGNTYRLEGTDTLIWRSRDGKDVQRLFRS